MAANLDASRRPLTGRMVLLCLVAFFAVVLLANGILIRAAVSTFGGLETASAYQAGQAFARETDAARAQDARQWQVKANVRLADGEAVVEIEARDAAGTPLAGLEASAAMHHPASRRSDHAVALSEGASGRFRGSAPATAGQWDVLIELSRGGERLFRSRNRVVLQ